MVNLTQIKVGTMTYINKEIISKAEPLQKFILGMAVGLAEPKVEKIVMQYANDPMIQTLEVVDESGMFDLDKIHIAAKQAIQVSGPIDIKGIIFNEKDIDKLVEYIKGVK